MNTKNNNPSIAKDDKHRWEMAPFHWFMEETKRLDQLLSLSMRGISMLQAAPKMVEALAAVDRYKGKKDNPNHLTEMKNAQEMADLANNEVRENFPLLHANNLVAIWSLLESVIRTFVAAWIANNPKAMTMITISKIKVRLGEYHYIPDADKPLYIAELLEEEIRANLRDGVNRFEAMLEPFGLNGEVSEEIKKGVFELGQIRNVLVHRGGYADRTLIDACPWLPFKVGEKIKISRDIYSRCFGAAHGYILELIIRIAATFGCDLSRFRTRHKHTHHKKTKVISSRKHSS